MILTPEWSVAGTCCGTFPAEELLAQRGMYAADLGFARDHARAPLHGVLDAVERALGTVTPPLSLNIDVRVHELREGDYPATPGWHCDAPLREVSFSDSTDKVPVSDTLLVSVSSEPLGVSNTVFAPHAVEVANESMDRATWQELDELYGRSPDFGVRTRDGELIRATAFTPHRVEAARRGGVRMFVRCSLWVPPEGHVPGLSRFEQVYRTGSCVQ